MPDFVITDSAGKPIDVSAVKWNSPSSIAGYLKSESLHLAVVPDYLAIKDKTLSAAVPKPASFNLTVQHDFQLGVTAPEIDFTPGAEVKLLLNATAGSDLFEDDPFHLPLKTPAGVAYAGMSLEGSLTLGVSGTSGDLTFGVTGHRSATFLFCKAFPVGAGEPTVWNATVAMLSDFVIPASLADLQRLGPNDVCSVSGDGSLKISGSVGTSISANPLASPTLPLNIATFSVKGGAMAGLSASLVLSGSYQIRVERLSAEVVRLSYLREKGTTLKTDLRASAGVAVDLGKTDLLAKMLGIFETGSADAKLLAGLTPDEVKTFTGALKDGLDHSLQASLDAELSTSLTDDIAFQYEITPAKLTPASSPAVASALKGDLSLLTVLEENMQHDGTLAPGVRLLNSVFLKAKDRGFSLKVNLLGIVNLISTAKLLSKCEFLYEPASGDLTIKETASSDRIDAITDPVKRADALCKAMFDSVLVTTTYVVSKAIALPELSCEAVHFAANRNTNPQMIADYTNWFVALNLLSRDERTAIVWQATRGGYSTCVARAPFDETACEALFLDGQGNLRDRAYYLEIGRGALKALLNAESDEIDKFRYDFFDNEASWSEGVRQGPNGFFADLIPLPRTDNRLTVVLRDISGDLYDILWWADSMQKAGTALKAMREFLGTRNPANLTNDAEFASRRDALQKLMLGVVGASRIRFHEPWGLVCLYRAAGSGKSAGRLSAGALLLEKTNPGQSTSVAGR